MKLKLQTGLIASLATIFAFIWQVSQSFTDKVAEDQLYEIKKLVEGQNHTNALLRQGSTTKRSLTEDKTTIALCNINGDLWQVGIDKVLVMIGPTFLWKKTDHMDVINKGTVVRVIQTDNSGILGLGSDWYKVEYCDKQILKNGWIASKTASGTETLIKKTSTN